MPHCLFFVHQGNVSSGTDGTFKQSKAFHRYEESKIELMMNIYAGVCQSGAFFSDKKMGVADIKQYMKKIMDESEDWYLSPAEAVRFGFADAILGSEGYEDITTISEAV
jgi:ATP-dependent protease ClpP protease subunit